MFRIAQDDYARLLTIVSASGVGMTVLTWDAPGYTQLAIYVGSANGTAMTGTLGPSGSEPTGDWVIDGMQFVLVDLTTRTAIASVIVHVSTDGNS